MTSDICIYYQIQLNISCSAILFYLLFTLHMSNVIYMQTCVHACICTHTTEGIWNHKFPSKYNYDS